MPPGVRIINSIYGRGLWRQMVDPSNLWIAFVWICIVLPIPSGGIRVLLDQEWNTQQAIIPASDEGQLFGGNQTNQNYFYQMYMEDDYVLIAARNMVYNVSLSTLTEARRLVWYSEQTDTQLCLLKQKTPDECQNYIRVIIRKGKDRRLICGTNAFRPLCRTYSEQQIQKRGCGLSSDDAFGAYVCEESGIARCPYDPTHNSSAVYAGGRLFFATVADISARDSLIFSSPLRTEQHDSQWLNDPDFVSSYEFGDKVYFFFREMAVENINCGKAVFSRVARVCSNDRGGERVLRNTWTSFFKARLNCSIPGEFPFYFDEIQSTSELGNGSVFPTLIINDRVPMVYGVFTTPRNGIRGSAVCAYRFSDVVASFEGAFKEQRTAHSNWLPVRESDVPNPHPAKACLHNSSALSDQMLNFIKWHPLMDRAVPAFGGQPIIVQASFNFSFTKVAVDWQVYAADHRYYDVLFIGTDDGHVIKVINRGRGQQMETEVIEVLQVFPDGEPIIDIKVHQNAAKNLRKFVVLSQNEMRSFPLHRCHLKTTCSECVALKDPYCSWLNNECVDSDLGLQSIETGRHSKCALTENVTNLPLPTDASSTAHPPGCVPCVCGPSTTADGTTSETLEMSSITSSENADTLPTTVGQVLVAEVTEVTSIPEIVFQEVKELGRCPEVAALQYSSSSMALAAILSTVFSLLAGFAIGYVLAVKRHTTIYRLRHAKGLSFNRNGQKAQNLYEVDAASQPHSCNERCSALPNGKPCNIYHNDLKENNVPLTNANNHAEALDQRRTIAYL